MYRQESLARTRDGRKVHVCRKLRGPKCLLLVGWQQFVNRGEDDTDNSDKDDNNSGISDSNDDSGKTDKR